MQAGALALDAVSVRFGGIAAVSEATVAFAPGTINGLIGPNGAGKTTLLNAVSGFAAVSSGRIDLDGAEITAAATAARARRGVVRGFQTVRLLERESVFDNVLVGCERFPQPGLLAQLLDLPAQRRCRARDLDAAARIVARRGLGAGARGAGRLGAGRRPKHGRARSGRPASPNPDEPCRDPLWGD